MPNGPNIYFQMVCQKLCHSSVSGWGPLKVSNFPILYILHAKCRCESPGKLVFISAGSRKCLLLEGFTNTGLGELGDGHLFHFPFAWQAWDGQLSPSFKSMSFKLLEGGIAHGSFLLRIQEAQRLNMFDNSCHMDVWPVSRSGDEMLLA